MNALLRTGVRDAEYYYLAVRLSEAREVGRRRTCTLLWLYKFTLGTRKRSKLAENC